MRLYGDAAVVSIVRVVAVLVIYRCITKVRWMFAISALKLKKTIKDDKS